MTGDIRPFVFKDEKYRWFARMPKRTPAKARRLLKVALVARGIVEPDAELPVEYVRHEDFGTYLYRTMNKYRPSMPGVPGRPDESWFVSLQPGDRIVITNNERSTHCLQIGSIATVQRLRHTQYGPRVYAEGVWDRGFGAMASQWVLEGECRPVNQLDR